MGLENGITELKENLDQQRIKELKRLLILFLIWPIWLVITPIRIHPNLSDLAQSLVLVFLMIGLLLLIGSVIVIRRIVLLQKQIWSTPGLREMVDDDIVRFAWLRAATIGFWAMLSVEIILTISRYIQFYIGGVHTQAPWSGTHGPIVIAIGILTVVSAFLFFRRD